MTCPVHFTIEERLATLVLADPQRRNVLSNDMYDGIEQAIDDLETEPASVLRLRAEGTAFSAGIDLAAGVEDPEELVHSLGRLGSIIGRLRTLSAVVVAEVDGPALAGGCALVAGSDIVYASRNGVFGYPVHRVGLSPAVSTPTLAAMIGPGPARSLALSGESIDAEAALRCGLVHELFDDAATLATAVQQLCQRLLSHPPEVLAQTKRAFAVLDVDADEHAAARALDATLATARNTEAIQMLAAFWSRRSRT
ncbi:MAG: enoyl-CoA hydratase/isomerase family protein [Phycisphaerales bacterium]|nr:enoyl-CoA hydratase/isomerase family protein [Phycisphaerales bacterium]